MSPETAAYPFLGFLISAGINGAAAALAEGVFGVDPKNLETARNIGRRVCFFFIPPIILVLGMVDKLPQNMSEINIMAVSAGVGLGFWGLRTPKESKDY